ncbi:MAG: arginine N-succinyltransferase [Terricaulis sp.]
MSAPGYVMRAAGPADLEGFKQLREIAGAGFTSLMLDDKAMAAKLALSEQSFASSTHVAGSERYFIALEHIESGTLAGCCGVKSTIGEVPPYFNFRMFTEAQSSNVVNRRVVYPDGTSPFWEAVGRHFFKMDFAEADKLSATTDNQFILDLMPQHAIYVDLLSQEAREVVGKCHKDGEGAQRLLEWEGFAFANVVDIFDGGPLMSVQRDHIRTLRESKRYKVEPTARLTNAKRALIAVPNIQTYRCVSAHASVANGVAQVDPTVLVALKVEAGCEVLVWMDDAH